MCPRSSPPYDQVEAVRADSSPCKGEAGRGSFSSRRTLVIAGPDPAIHAVTRAAGEAMAWILRSHRRMTERNDDL